MNRLLGVSIALWAAASVHAQEIAPNPNLRAEGIPPIPAALARQAALYTEFRPRSVVSWHPVRHELLVATRATNTTQLHHVRRPLGELSQATDYAEPVRSGPSGRGRLRRCRERDGAISRFPSMTGGSRRWSSGRSPMPACG